MRKPQLPQAFYAHPSGIPGSRIHGSFHGAGASKDTISVYYWREPAFVDTHVLVYAPDASNEAKHHQAVAILKRLWRERAGRLSVQVLNEYDVTLTRKLKVPVAQEDAWEDVPIDREILNRAREIERRYDVSWWDSMIVAAAQAQRSPRKYKSQRGPTQSRRCRNRARRRWRARCPRSARKLCRP